MSLTGEHNTFVSNCFTFNFASSFSLMSENQFALKKDESTTPSNMMDRHNGAQICKKGVHDIKDRTLLGKKKQLSKLALVSSINVVQHFFTNRA